MPYFQVSHWVNTICDKSMQELHDLSKPFKYVISCVIVQKNGAGFHIGHSAYWDMINDNVCQASPLLIASKGVELGRESMFLLFVCAT